jgi:ABC-type taurine transport system substrate-binding protein
MITLAKLHKFIIKIFRTVFSDHTFMEKYPKMQISFEKYKYKLPRIQKYITNSKYWKNNNKNGEKMEFIRLHTLHL